MPESVEHTAPAVVIVGSQLPRVRSGGCARSQPFPDPNCCRCERRRRPRTRSIGRRGRSLEGLGREVPHPYHVPPSEAGARSALPK
jgi:hypothetical protein